MTATRTLILTAALTAILVAALAIATDALAAQSWQFPTGKQLVAVHKSRDLRGASPDGRLHVPLLHETTRDRYRSPDVAPVAIGPVDLHRGDVLLIDLGLQYVNPNTRARGAWSVINGYGNLVQSEHWSLWVMGASGVRINDALTFDNSDWAMPQHEENFDNYRHYMAVDRSTAYVVDRDRPHAYIFPRTYFIASSGYTIPGAEMQLPGDGYQELSVLVFR